MAPHAPRVLVLLLVGLAPLLAGCAESPAPEPAAATPDAVVLTRPQDTGEAAGAAGDMGWHLHDYWEGQPRFTAVDATVHVGGWNCDGCDRIPLRHRGATGQIVPLGTAALEITVTWTDLGEPRHGQPELWVKTAAMREPTRVATLVSGVPFLMNTTNDHADPPHQALSRWEYWVMLPSVEGQGRYEGETHVYAEAIRGLDIPLFPPHPDLWGGQTEIPLFEGGAGPLFQLQDPVEGSRTCQGDCLGVHAPESGVIVPWDATEVVVTLTHAPGIPAFLGLRAHGSDTWDMTVHPGEVAPPLSRTFRIPVTAETGDSPYAKQSLWEFEVVIDQPTQKQAYAGGYEIRAVAVK